MITSLRYLGLIGLMAFVLAGCSYQVGAYTAIGPGGLTPPTVVTGSAPMPALLRPKATYTSGTLFTKVPNTKKAFIVSIGDSLVALKGASSSIGCAAFDVTRGASPGTATRIWVVADSSPTGPTPYHLHPPVQGRYFYIVGGVITRAEDW